MNVLTAVLLTYSVRAAASSSNVFSAGDYDHVIIIPDIHGDPYYFAESIHTGFAAVFPGRFTLDEIRRKIDVSPEIPDKLPP